MMTRPLRHSRSNEFNSALRLAASEPAVERWTELADDPNAAIVLAQRAETLRAAWRDPIPDRTLHVVDQCRNKRVLDIGCVAHDVARMHSSNWLHAQIADVSKTCLGVDVVERGVEAMKALGYEAVLHDLSDGLGPLEHQAPFDVILAGELIEHVGSIDMLFQTAKQLLTPTGRLILTTPNPYAPARVHAGQRGIVWENVDHILYAFPSGIAELAERHGLALVEARTTASPSRVRLRGQLKQAKRTILGRRWRALGFATLGERQIVSTTPAMAWLRDRLRTSSAQFVGETFVYLVGHSRTDGD